MVHISRARFWRRFHSSLDRSGKAITGGRRWAFTEGLMGSWRKRGRAKIFSSEECEMWFKCSKISYCHDHFKTPSLEVLELKIPQYSVSESTCGKKFSCDYIVCSIPDCCWRRQEMNIHELLKKNYGYWAVFLLHTLVPPDRAIGGKESEEVLRIRRSSSTAFANSTKAYPRLEWRSRSRHNNCSPEVLGCLRPVCNSNENNLLTSHSFSSFEQ